jgi:hypothetical protein
MTTPHDRKEFVEKLLARDPPPPDELRQHQGLLFRKIRRRIVLYKVAVGAVYVGLFLLAFWASLRQERAESVARSLLWGSVSVYVLLWFLVWFLRGIYRGLAPLVEKGTAGGPKWRRQDRFITIVAVAVFAFSGLLLYRSFSLTDPLRAAQQATACFWATVFFLFWYPFGTASLVARIWLEYKKTELRLTNGKEPDPENQAGSPSDPAGRSRSGLG